MHFMRMFKFPARLTITQTEHVGKPGGVGAIMEMDLSSNKDKWGWFQVAMHLDKCKLRTVPQFISNDFSKTEQETYLIVSLLVLLY